RESIDESSTDTLENKGQKDSLVSHAADGYWAERDGIQQIAMSGLSSRAEPPEEEVTEIAEIGEEEHSQHGMYEASTSNKTAEIIQDSIGADKLSIHSVEVLTEEDIEKDRDYPSIMKDNLDVLDQATSKGGQSDA